jgi:uncharacterized protein
VRSTGSWPAGPDPATIPEINVASTESRPLAVVTGASSGIGLRAGRQFAEHGYDLIIAAGDDAINTAAGQLQNGAAVEAVQVDLATPEGVEQLYERIRQHGDQVEAVALKLGSAWAGTSPLRPTSTRS